MRTRRCPLDKASRKQKAKRKKCQKHKVIPFLLYTAFEGDHPQPCFGMGETLASLRRAIPEGSLMLAPSFQANIHAQVTVRSSHVTDAPVYTAADTVTSSRGKTHVAPTEKDVEIARLKSLVEEKETESAEVSPFHGSCFRF
ncbi:hypothetical protein Tco_1319891 [Tanacetum coccineum]